MEFLNHAVSDHGADVNDKGYGDSTGMFNIDTAVNREEGTRSYAANAYLRDPKSIFPQPNLIVLKGVYATKILFDSNNCAKDAKAVGLTCLGGVDWKSPGTEMFPFDLKVDKEIIVSAGELDDASNAQIGDLVGFIDRYLQHPSTPRA